VGFFAAAQEMSAKLAAGALSPEKAAVAPQLIFNQRLDAYLTLFFVLVLWVIVLDMLRVCARYMSGRIESSGMESPYVKTMLE
jgi:carbon starvation protein